jgi:hypothetical protein
VIWLKKSRGEQKSHGLHRKQSVQWINERGGTSTRKEGRKGKKDYRQQRNKLQKATEKAMNKCVESICKEITEFQQGFMTKPI